MSVLTVRRFVKQFSKNKRKLVEVTDFGEPVGTWVPAGHSKAAQRSTALKRLFAAADASRPKPFDTDAIQAEVRRRRGRGA